MKLSDYVIRWGKDRPDHAFLSLDGKTITYGEADAFTKGKGESLPEEVHGKVVALYLTDPASQVLWFLAVERAGAVPLLVHEYIKGERFEELFDARPIDFFLTDSETGGVSVSKREDGLFFGRIKDTGITRKEGVAVLTSGSSGLSKILSGVWKAGRISSLCRTRPLVWTEIPSCIRRDPWHSRETSTCSFPSWPKAR